jgi:arylsulfatase A-like enzyme
MDIGPAILEMAGIEVPKTFEAQSILPAIQGKDWTPRDYVYAEQIKDGILTETEFMSMIRNEEWKLVHFLHMKCGQLFNLKDDPDEVVNLWDEPAASGVKQKLLDQLREWHIESQVHTHDWAAEWR